MTLIAPDIDWDSDPVAATHDLLDVGAFPRTDAGNAELFAFKYQHHLRHDHNVGAWMVWNRHHWRLDRDGEVRRLAKHAVRARQAAAIRINHDDDRKLEAKWAVASESRRALDAMLTVACAERPLAVTGDHWDIDPMLFGVANGVIDLSRGTLRNGEPEDGITKVAPVTFDPRARCPRWEQFVREIFADHLELVDYLQRVVGYTMTGITTEQMLWILFGLGSNGKSTFMETLFTRVFGPDLAWTMPFPAAAWSDSMSEYQRAALQGRRLVQSIEVTKRGHLNEEVVKSLTGDDTVSARHPYGRPFQFKPVAKLFLRVNEKPVIRDEGHGMWRRIKLVPFSRTFPVDTSLAAILAAEAPGILQWAVQGCREWQRDGLPEPSVVQASTAEYRSENDPLTTFLDECCVQLDGVSIKAGQLYHRYTKWAGDHLRVEDRLTQTAFGKRMKARFRFTEGRHTVYFGVGLLTTDEAER